MAGERTGSWEKKNEGRDDEVMGCWRWADRVEVQPVKGQPGRWEQEAGQTTGERVVGRETTEVDWKGTVVQEEGWQVGVLVPDLGSGGAGGQQGLAEEGCHRGRPHWLLARCLQGAGNVHVPGHWRGRD